MSPIFCFSMSRPPALTPHPPRVLAAYQQHGGKGVTVMVTTHFMDEAEYCDRIGLVYRGKLIAQRHAGRPENQAADDEQPDPTMEQAFITLIHDWDKENAMRSNAFHGAGCARCASKRRGRSCATPAAG
jgi:ABC-type multidrug transport system ATPase subunit